MRKGDKVVCIDATASFNRLQQGAIYEVGEAYDGTLGVFVGEAFHCIDRFEEVA